MTTLNVPLRSGRGRGRNVNSPRKKLAEITTHRASSPKAQRLIARGAKTRETPKLPPKRRRGEPAPIGGFTRKAAGHWSVYRENRTNVKRKPDARHKPAVKQALKRDGLAARRRE